MFKYISEILSHFTKTQRVLALLMILTTITIISLAPSFISSITTDRTELESKIERQSNRIKLLENQIDTLDFRIRENKKSCTQEIYSRESEFITMLDEIRAEAFKYKVNTKTESRQMPRYVESDEDGVMLMRSAKVEQNNNTEVKVDISPVLNKIDNIKKKVRH